MRILSACLRKLAGIAFRTLLVMLTLAMPVLAVPKAGTGARFIEAPANANSGIGLVLLVSLQRA